MHKAYEKLIDKKADEIANAMRIGMVKSFFAQDLLFDKIVELLEPYREVGIKDAASIREITKMMELNQQATFALERISKTPLMMQLLKEVPLSDANRSNEVNS